MKLYPIETGNFKLDGGAMFGVVPKSLWQRTNPADANNMIDMAARCLLIEDGERLILIDSGMGDKQSEKFFGYYYRWGDHTLDGSLEKHGFRRDDITDVFLTHLHFDHCGGCIQWNKDRTGYEPAFKNARFWTNRDHWEWATKPNAREKASFLKENLLPMQESGQLQFLATSNTGETASNTPERAGNTSPVPQSTGNAAPVSEATANTSSAPRLTGNKSPLPRSPGNMSSAGRPSGNDEGGLNSSKPQAGNFLPVSDLGFGLLFMDGHTDKQMLPFIDYNGKKLVFVADLLPTVGHLPIPYVMGFDTRPLLTLKEKSRFLEDAADNNYILFFEHDAHNEICTVKHTEKGVRLDKSYAFHDLFS